MRSPLRLCILFALFIFPFFTNAQQSINNSVNRVSAPPVPGTCAFCNNPNTAAQRSGPNPSPLNGNNTLGNIYSNSACGLDFTTASQRLGQRFFPAGVPQPAPFVIAGIPAGSIIVKAFLWAEGSGNGAAQTAVVTGPLGTANYPMTIVGTGPDKCWGYSGSYTYRADVTASVNGNATYNISGILVNSPNDMDGATLMVIWRNPASTFLGTITIDDGAMVVNTYLGNVTYNMTYPAIPCGNISNSLAFACVGDLQLAGTDFVFNGTIPTWTYDWWNYIPTATTLTTGQTSSTFSGTASSGDCFNLCVAGLYYRTTPTLTISATPATCSGCNGTATVVACPNTPVTYSWAPSGGTGATASGLCAGTYTVTVVSACITNTISVVVPLTGGSLTLNQAHTNDLCNGQCNGTATITASGGSAPYTFTWAPAVTNSTVGAINTATGLCPGTYVVTGTDAGGCTGTQTVTITQPAVLAGTFAQTNLLCNAASNGTASITMSGGTGPYTFTWAPAVANSTVGSTNTATGLTANTYVVTATDANGCSITHTFIITQPPPLGTTFSQVNNLCNGGATGSATFTISGGAAPYTFAWAPATTNSTVGSTNTATGLAANTYVVTATDANGCQIAHTFIITQPAALAGTFAQTNISCNGGANGTAAITMSGGTGTYTFTWAPAAANSTVGSTNTATGLSAGTYVVTATDANGCTFPHTFTITQPLALSGTFAQTNVLCNGGSTGSASITVSGGTAPYTFAWSPAAANSTVGTTNTATGLAVNTYVVMATDANGCTFSNTFTITQPPALAATFSQVDVLCNSATTGSASITMSGGTAPYTFTWAPASANSTVGSTNTATGLGANTYVVTATDVNGCTFTHSFIITQPPALSGTFAQTDVLCNGASTGTASITMSGGTGPYTFVWAPASANTTVGNTNTATGLVAGTYVVTATDANGCSFPHTFTLLQPTPLTATTSSTNSTCGNANGSATVNPSGGAGGYTQLWTPSGQTTATAINLLAGVYSVTVTDANLCTYTTSVTVVNTGSPAITIPTFTNVTCNGACDGTANAVATGGTAPYTFAWSPAGGTGISATGLCPGVYTCTVTDANGCNAAATVTITEPPALAITPSQVNLLCNGVCNGSATVAVTGGTPGYTYLWAPSGGTGSTASGLCAGTYTCTVTDANGCTLTQSFTITEPTLLTLASAGFNVTCFGVCDGQVVVIPSGGTPVYNFSWSTGCTAASCSNICAGTYTVTVTDFNGCLATSVATVTQPPPVTVTATSIDAHCNLPDGSATCAFNGGTGVLTPVWYNPMTPGANLNNVIAGNYFVVVTDANGCDDTANVTINNIPGVTATAGTIVPVSCFGGNNGSASITISGGTGIITYTWSCSPSTTTTANNLVAGNCSVVATDSAGCTSSVDLNIPEPTQLTVTATSTPTAICVGQSSTITATGAGGTPGYSYSWSPISQAGASQIVAPLATQVYSVTVTDANNCIDSTTVTVTVNPNPVSAFAGDSLAGCAPHCVNFSDLSNVASGTIIGWAWDFGDGTTSTLQNPQHCYQLAGNYTVILTITTATGCTGTITMPNYIAVYGNPVAEFSAFPQPTTELNPEITFTDLSTNANSWSWSFGDANNGGSVLQNPVYNFGGPGCFDVILTVTTVNGCIDTTLHRVCIDPDVTLFVPNAFTPNGDGVNDVFVPRGVGIDPDHFEMWIFDRWGNMIFYTNDISKGWDGSVQGRGGDVAQIDTYVWKIKAVDLMDGKHDIIGHVSLIK